jgi:hypothetical protein
MNTKIDQKTVKDAISESFDFWLTQHPISMGDLIKEGIKEAAEEAFSRWLEDHSEQLIQALGQKTPPS